MVYRLFHCPENSLYSAYLILLYFFSFFNTQDINNFVKQMLYYLLELYTVLYVFPWLHDNIQDNVVNNRQMHTFNF